MTQTPSWNFEILTISELKFDPDNPRLPFIEDRENESKVLEWMLSDGTIIELMGSIGEQGYFIGEPLLVTPSEQGGYVVVEGNRRFAAVKLLSDPSLAPTRKRIVEVISEGSKHRPVELPCVIFRTRDEILDYLGYRHITGIKEWDPLAKARYLEQLYASQTEGEKSEKFRSVAKIIGSRSDYVARLLTGLSVYDDMADHSFFGLEGVDQRSVKFSLLTTAINYTNIANFLGLETGDLELRTLQRENLEEFTSWMFEKNRENQTRLGESRNLAQLSDVVGNEKALERFRQGTTLLEAHAFTTGPNNTYRQVVNEAKARLETALSLVSKLDNISRSDADTMAETIKTARAIRGALLESLDDDV